MTGSNVLLQEIEDNEANGFIVEGYNTPRFKVILAADGLDVKKGDVVYLDPNANGHKHNGMYIVRQSAILAKEA